MARSLTQSEREQSKQLLHAMLEGDFDSIREMILTPPVADSRLENEPLLLIAAQISSAEVVGKLLESGADPNARNRETLSTALHHAAQRGDAEMVELLLDHGTKIHLRTRQDGQLLPTSAVELAGQACHGPIVELLESRGASKRSVKAAREQMRRRHQAANEPSVSEFIKEHSAGTYPVLHRAAMSGRVDVIDALAAQGADLNERSASGFTALHLASANRPESVSALIEAGAEVNALSRYQDHSPLDRAVTWEARALLIRAGAKHGRDILSTEQKAELDLFEAIQRGEDIEPWMGSVDLEAKDPLGRTPLLAAINHSRSTGTRKALVERLLSEGANPNAVDYDGAPALFVALRDGHADLVSLLLLHGADRSIRDAKGRTLLHMAASGGFLDLVRQALDDGVDPNLPGQDGLTPLHYAAWHGHFSVADELLTRGAQVNAPDALGSTPLHTVLSGWRITETDTKMARFLIERGADVTHPGAEALTPLHHVARLGQLVLAEELIARGAQIDAPDVRGATPLHKVLDRFFLESTDTKMAKFLVERGADTALRPSGFTEAMEEHLREVLSAK